MSQVRDLESLSELRPGMLVRHKLGDSVYVVTANYGTRVTAVDSVDITNPDEWLIVECPPERCLHTGNPCGTDTWPIHGGCMCPPCIRYRLRLEGKYIIEEVGK